MPPEDHLVDFKIIDSVIGNDWIFWASWLACV